MLSVYISVQKGITIVYIEGMTMKQALITNIFSSASEYYSATLNGWEPSSEEQLRLILDEIFLDVTADLPSLTAEDLI